MSHKTSEALFRRRDSFVWLYGGGSCKGQVEVSLPLQGQVHLSLGYIGGLFLLPLLTPLAAGSGHVMAKQLDHYGPVTCFSSLADLANQCGLLQIICFLTQNHMEVQLFIWHLFEKNAQKLFLLVEDRFDLNVSWNVNCAHLSIFVGIWIWCHLGQWHDTYLWKVFKVVSLKIT